jgi:hypothetical protein
VSGLRGATSIRACPDVATDLNVSIFVSLHRRLRFIKLQQPSCWRLILVRPKFSPVLLALKKRCLAPELELTILQVTNNQESYMT